ncbi:hypothetical protein BDA99DRAFT_517445 [Phascolomyces articulosus]|uniref:Uncharacterized protein n=1 Tax=Phascolomyces articulosus TaxID=60185 RepID=A0AAD5PBT0_9FUNG|nr:hypothetical protein BDA99DRAFT_517445 [Phascolomyces articulosus]
MYLQEKVIVIYGGTSGIGLELSETLLSLGAYVIFLGTKKEKGKALEAELNNKYRSDKKNQMALFHQCDITDWGSQEAIYSLSTETFDQSVDVVIVIAGILDSSNLMNDIELDNDNMLVDGTYRTLEVNLTAAAKANRLAIQHFLRNNKPGCVINTSSIYGYVGAPLAPLYAASKHGIIGLSKSYGTLFRSTGIRVNVVAPHFVDTPMVTGPSKAVAKALGMVPMSRCIDAYIQLIENDLLEGDVLVVTSEKTYIEQRYPDSTSERLDHLCSERKRQFREQIHEYFLRR